MRRCTLPSVVAAVLALFPMPGGAAELVKQPAVLNLDEAAFRLGALRAVPNSAGQPAGELLTVEFEVENAARGRLDRVGVEATVFSAEGELRGFYIFDLPVHLNPGASSYVRASTGRFHASASDRIVLLPYAASGPGLRWRIGAARMQEVTQLIAAAQGDVERAEANLAAAALVNATGSAVTPQSPTPPSDPYGGGCAAQCQNASSSCTATCPCGVSSVSCSCQPDGSYSDTCTCFQCPKGT